MTDAGNLSSISLKYEYEYEYEYEGERLARGWLKVYFSSLSGRYPKIMTGLLSRCGREYGKIVGSRGK